jgi:hypothetical protein
MDMIVVFHQAFSDCLLEGEFKHRFQTTQTQHAERASRRAVIAPGSDNLWMFC